MSEGEVFPVPEAWAKRAHMDAAAYDAAWKRVEADPDAFWRDVAVRIGSSRIDGNPTRSLRPIPAIASSPIRRVLA